MGDSSNFTYLPDARQTGNQSSRWGYLGAKGITGPLPCVGVVTLLFAVAAAVFG